VPPRVSKTIVHPVPVARMSRSGRASLGFGRRRRLALVVRTEQAVTGVVVKIEIAEAAHGKPREADPNQDPS
jgi:hypothetical protein